MRCCCTHLPFPAHCCFTLFARLSVAMAWLCACMSRCAAARTPWQTCHHSFCAVSSAARQHTHTHALSGCRFVIWPVCGRVLHSKVLCSWCFCDPSLRLAGACRNARPTRRRGVEAKHPCVCPAAGAHQTAQRAAESGWLAQLERPASLCVLKLCASAARRQCCNGMRRSNKHQVITHCPQQQRS